MNNKIQNLLDDVLSDAAPPGFRAELLDATLQHVRRRKHLRHWNRGLAVVAVMLAAISFALWRTSSPDTQPVLSGKPDLIVVRSRPLDPSRIVTTTPGTVAVVSSSPSTFALVKTGSAEHLFREIDDEQLLALLQGKPAALVRHGPNEVELIFLNPEDEKGFPVQ
jgi:hypothetical protein